MLNLKLRRDLAEAMVNNGVSPEIIHEVAVLNHFTGIEVCKVFALAEEIRAEQQAEEAFARRMQEYRMRRADMYSPLHEWFEDYSDIEDNLYD